MLIVGSWAIDEGEYKITGGVTIGDRKLWKLGTIKYVFKAI